MNEHFHFQATHESTSRGHELDITSVTISENDSSTSLDNTQLSTLPDDSLSRTQALDTTVSSISKKKVRTRLSSKWICTFQIMDAKKNTIQQQNSVGSFPVTEEKSKANIDDLLKKFFKAYNEKAKLMRKSGSEVLHALGGRYMFHSQLNLIVGIVVLETQLCNTPQFDCHLLLEKFAPNKVPIFGDSHKTYIGHAYPIHTTDLSCIGGNSLRPLLNNWIDDTFFKSLHWIIPPSTISMRRFNKEEAEIRDEEALLDFIELITEMKKLLLKFYRENLSETQNNDAPSQSQATTATSVYEYMTINEGMEYPVESHHWYSMQIPLNEKGTVNELAYRAVTSIKRKGGKVKTVSKK